jgi:hypothetical protein
MSAIKEGLIRRWQNTEGTTAFPFGLLTDILISLLRVAKALIDNSKTLRKAAQVDPKK